MPSDGKGSYPKGVDIVQGAPRGDRDPVDIGKHEDPMPGRGQRRTNQVGMTVEINRKRGDGRGN